jgi:hypothetical protein
LEIEKNSQIPFLDVRAERCSNKLISMFTENKLAHVDTLLQTPIILKATKTLFFTAWLIAYAILNCPRKKFNRGSNNH